MRASELDECPELVTHDNSRMLFVYKLVIVICMTVFMMESRLFSLHRVFFVSTLCGCVSLVELFLVLFLSKYRKVVYTIIYLSFAQLSIFGVVFALASSSIKMDAGYFIIFVIAPIMFLVRPLHLFISQTITIIGFCVTIFIVKSTDVAVFDMLNAVFSYIISLCLSFTIMSKRLHSFSVISRERKVYENELAKSEVISPGVLISHKINLSKNIVEESFTEDKELAAFLQYINATELFTAIKKNITKPDDMKKAKEVLSRSNLIDMYEEGVSRYTFTYERNYSDSLYYGEIDLHLMKKIDNGDIMLLLFLRDVTQQCLGDKVMMAVSQKNYEMLAILNTKNQIVNLVYGHDNTHKLSSGNTIDYLKMLYNFIDRCVINEEQDNMRHILQIKNILLQLERNETFSVDYILKDSQNKQQKRKMFTFSFLDRSKGVILITRSDITKMYVQEMNRNMELQKALDEAQKAGQARQEFLSHMSHEIRTPMNGIKGTLDILKNYDSLKDDKFLKNALVSTDYLINIVNDILDLSKIESGKCVLHYSWNHYQTFMESVFMIIEPMAEAKEIRITRENRLERNTSIYVDSNRLKQILVNILSNAVKYSPRGSQIEYYETVDFLSKEHMRIHVHIVDNGRGMSEEFISHALEPFEQEGSSDEQVGTGLGLAITKKLLTLMKGTISIESKIQEGTHVTIVYDCKFCNTLVDDIQVMMMGDNPEPDIQGKHGLLVEDNEINREIARAQFEAMGLVIDTASDGFEAIKKFEESVSGFYDIIFMDIMMPHMDGLAATKKIREMNRPDAKEVPIIALTANAFSEDVNESIRSGMNYHLSKPFERNQLIQILLQIFGRIK